MSKSLCIRLKSAVFSFGMLTSVCVGVFLLTWHTFFNLIIYNLSVGPLTLNQIGSMFLNDIHNSHARSGFDLFAPVLAVLPSSTLFCDDYNSGYINSILGRVEIQRYIKENIICSSIAGGLAVFLPSLITSILYIAIGEPNLAVNITQGYTTFLDESIFANIQFILGGGLVVVMLLILSFLFGALWSNVGLYFSSVLPNRYIALAGPFIFYYAMHLIFYRLRFLLVLSPVNMLMPTAIFIPNLAYPFIYQIAFIYFITYLFKRKVERRLVNA